MDNILLDKLHGPSFLLCADIFFKHNQDETKAKVRKNYQGMLTNWPCQHVFLHVSRFLYITCLGLVTT